MAHVVIVGHHYFVGSFDDDANYILTGRALLDGHGLTGHLPSGDAVVSGYPPGYPALLVPLLWLFPHTFVPLRVLTVGFFVAAFPLTWWYLGLRGMPDSVRVAVMGLMAFDPVLATYGTMVMAELPFVCCALVLLIAVDRWERSPRVLGPVGVLVVLLGAEAVWLKEAGVALVLGVALWLLLRRQAWRAVATVAGLVTLLVPVVVARVVDHVPLAGTRYSQELGGYYQGGLVDRLVHVLPTAAETWLRTALPLTVIPFGAPLPQHGFWHHAIVIVSLQVPVFTVLGLAVTVRRHRDVAVVAVPAYVAETVLWPQINERRVVLVLPFLLAWYALGVRTTVRWVLDHARHRSWSARTTPVALGLVGVVVVLAPLLSQFSRDYLFAVGQDSSRPEGSRYMAVLAAAGSHDDVVESDYRYTTALFTGHRTEDDAFVDEIVHGSCSEGIARAALAADRSGYLLLGSVNKPDHIDNSCLMSLATTRPWAVRLLRTARDQASVFELIGPGTAHPDLVDLIAGVHPRGSDGLALVPVRSAGAGDHPGAAATTPTRGGGASLTWSFGRTRPVTQVAVGEAGLTVGAAEGVSVEIEGPQGPWETVAHTARAVGDGRGDAPFLLATLPSGTRSRAVRIVVHGTGRAIALDVSALGPAGRSSS